VNLEDIQRFQGELKSWAEDYFGSFYEYEEQVRGSLAILDPQDEYDDE